MLIQNNTTWAKMPLGQKVTWAIVYWGKDTTLAKTHLGNAGLGKESVEQQGLWQKWHHL